MSTIRENVGQDLTWIQPARTQQAFELHAGDKVVATLRFERASLATGEADVHRWTFKREGFWHPRVTVRLPDSDDNAATFQPSWSGGGPVQFPIHGCECLSRGFVPEDPDNAWKRSVQTPCEKKGRTLRLPVR